jgi:hypothetical protein
MKRNIILFAIAMIAMIAFAGSAQALVEPVGGQVDKTDAEGQIVTLWVNDRWWDNLTVAITDVSGYVDAYGFEDISPLLTNAGVGTNSAYNLTVAMYCGGSNTYHNETGTHLYNILYNGNPKSPPILNLEPCSIPDPDLIVSDITVNYDASAIVNLAIGPETPGTRTQCNNISVNITELDGVTVGSGFDVKLEINGVEQACSPMQVPAGMAGGSTVTVYCDCSFRPIAGVQYNISATVDSGGVIGESDETNNTGWRNLTAITNGYAGDGWQDGRNISALQCHEEGPINLVYSHGDSYYLSGYYTKWDTYTVNWTASDLNIPPTDTDIKKARLYAYYHADQYGDKWANLSLTFNTVGMSEVAHYSDGKGFGKWDYSSDVGVLVYNVTDEFVIGDNTALVTNSNPSTPKGISMEAMVLVVVYENPNEPNRIIWINEGCDLISSKYAKYGVSPEEASTYAEFEGCEPIPLSEVGKATLVSIAQVGNQGDDKNRLYFNDGEWHGLFPSGYVTGTNIGIHEADVTPYLKAEDNVATYQDNGDMFAAANSFLVLELPDTFVEMDDYEMSTPGTMVAPIMLRNITNYGTGTITVSYNSSVVQVASVADGLFSTVYASNINNIAGTVTISALNNDGYSGDIEFARITFEAIGGDAETTQLTLSVDKLADKDYNNLVYLIDDGSITLREGVPPEMSSGDADPNPIIQTIVGGRDRLASRAISTLSIDVLDPGSGVKSVIIDLSTIGGGATTSMSGGATYSVDTDATIGINLVHNLVVTATDNNGNIATSTITLEVLRRGDVARNNKVDMGDALYIARNSVGLEPEADNWLLVGDVVGEGGNEEGDNAVDMVDALYISRLTVGLESQQP